MFVEIEMGIKDTCWLIAIFLTSQETGSLTIILIKIVYFNNDCI